MNVVISQPEARVLESELAQARAELYKQGWLAYFAGLDAWSDEPPAWLDGWLDAQAQYEAETGETCPRRVRDAYETQAEVLDWRT